MKIENLITEKNKPNYPLIRELGKILSEEKYKGVAKLLMKNIISNDKQLMEETVNPIKTYNPDAQKSAAKLLSSIVGTNNAISLTRLSPYIVKTSKATENFPKEKEIKKLKPEKRGPYFKPATQDKKEKITEYLTSLLDDFVFLVAGKFHPKTKEPCFKVTVSKAEFCGMYNASLLNDQTHLEIDYRQMCYYLQKKRHIRQL